MLGETRIAELLLGKRGRGGTDPSAVVAVLDALARLLLAAPQITDVEINPLRCAAEGVVALDARVLVAA